MWILRESENQITLIGISARNYILAIVFLICSVSFAWSMILSPNKVPSNLDLWVLVLLNIILIIASLMFLLYSSVIVTTFNENKEQMEVSSYKLSGKTTRHISFNLLTGFIESKWESYDGNRFHELFLNLNTGENIKLSSQPTMWKWNAVRTKDQANKYLKSMIEKHQKDDDFKLTIFDD